MSAPTTLELLWGTQLRPKRGPKPSLSLERIVSEAVALADVEGLANVSMQMLAERLGCTKMALYRYVPGKAELTALMLDAALGAPPVPLAVHPRSGAKSWRARLRAWAVTIFERYSAHRWTLELAIGARVMGPNEMAWLENALSALSGVGLSGAERLDTVVLLNGHVRSLVQQVGTATRPEIQEEQIAEAIAEVLTTQAERYPEVAAAFAEQGSEAAELGERNNALHFGIDRIIDGVEALIARRS